MLLLGACGRTATPAPSPISVEVTRVVPETVVVREVITRYVTPEAPSQPTELVLCLRQPPAHIDPLWREGTAEVLLWGLLGQTVVAAQPDGTWITEVFRRVPTLENGDARLVGEEGPDGHLEVTYTVRPGLRWEEGTAVTAEDFRRAWEAARSGRGSPRVQQMAQDVTDVRIEGERTFTVVLRQGLMTPLYPEYVFGPLPPSAGEDDTPVSFGPYRLLEHDAEEMLLVANPTFTGTLPVPQVRVRIIPDANDALVALLGGRCDVLSPAMLDVTALPWLRRAQVQGLVSYRAVPGRAWMHLDFNTWPPEGHTPFFADRRVRQAVLLALDREAILKEATDGLGERMASWLLPTQWAYAPQAPLSAGRSAPERARALLAEAGWRDEDGDGVREASGVKGTYWDGLEWTIPDGTPLRVTLMTVAGDGQAERAARLVRAQLAPVGIDVEVRSLPPARFFAPDSPVWQRTFDLALFAWEMSPDPDGRYLWLGNAICRRANGSLYAAQAGRPCEPGDELLHAPAIPGMSGEYQGGNVSGWANADASLAIYRATAYLRPDTRRPFYEQHQSLFAQDLPAIPLFERPMLVAWRSGWQGITPDPFLPFTWNVESWRYRR